MIFPGENQGGFSHFPEIYRIFCVKNLPETFFNLSGPCASATWNRSFPRHDLRRSSSAIARPWCFASVLDWPCFQLWRLNCMERLLYSASTLHPLRPYESEPICFGFVFHAKYSCGVVASFVSPTKFCTQRLVAMSSICDLKNFVGGYLFHTI